MHFKMPSAISFNLDQSNILSSGNGLMNVLILKNLINMKVTTVHLLSQSEVVLPPKSRKILNINKNVIQNSW